MQSKENQGWSASHTNKKDETLDFESSSPTFLKDIMGESIKIGQKAAAQQAAKHPEWKHGVRDPTTEYYIENCRITAACENAATNIVCKAGTMSVKERKDWKMHFGKPNTKVLLPSNDVFDTKLISSGGSKHATNNKLGHVQHELELHPGMDSNLDIDWSNQSSEFKEFMLNKSQGDQKCFGLKRKKRLQKLMS